MAFGIGSFFKDKVGGAVNKLADKIVPKEIAPLLPIAAAFIPGMLPATGLLGSTAARYLIPQALTALGSAKTTGKINPLSQLMTGMASYAAGPQNLTGAERAYMDANPADFAMDSVPGVPDAISGGGMNIDYGSAIPGDIIPKGTDMSFYKPGAVEQLKNFGTGIGNNLKALSGGNAPDATGLASILDPGLGSLAFKAGIGTTGALADQSIKEMQEAEAERLQNETDAEEQATAYNDAINELQKYYMSLADPDQIFGDPYEEVEFAANGGIMGGRIGLNEGGSAENATNQFQMKLAELLEVGVPLEEAEKQAMDFMQRAFKGLGGDYADGGRVDLNMGGIMGGVPQTENIPNGMQIDGRSGGFIPMGAQEKKDDVPAMLAKNEFVMTSDAVRAAGGGSIEKGAQRMYDLMNSLEARA